MTRRPFVPRMLSVAAACAFLLIPHAAGAQSGPPVTGAIATEGTIQSFYKSANVIIVKTIDGVEHAFQFTADLVVHGGHHPGPGALADLQEGRTVAVYYTAAGNQETIQELDAIGGEGLQVSEGMVTRVSRNELEVRFDNGRKERYRLTERAAADAGLKPGDTTQNTTVKVYYTNDHGEKVVHYFRKLGSADKH